MKRKNIWFVIIILILQHNINDEKAAIHRLNECRGQYYEEGKEVGKKIFCHIWKKWQDDITSNQKCSIEGNFGNFYFCNEDSQPFY